MKKSIKLKKGSVINKRYKVKSLIGKGGIGSTYLVDDKETNKEAALKVLYFSQIEDWKELELFEREVDVLKNLNYHSIPNYIDNFKTEIEGETIFAMVQDYIKGQNLYDRVKHGKKCSIEDSLTIFKSLLETLFYIHNLKPPIIHRDITPKNVIIDEENKVHLVDFGAVGHVVKDTRVAAMANTFVGTLGYMPPEQLFGKSSEASDLYSLGATIIFTLTGKEPSEFNLIDMKLDYKSYVNIPNNLMALLDRMIEPNVEQRINKTRAALNMLKNIIFVDDTSKVKLKEAKKTSKKTTKATKKTVDEKRYVSLLLEGAKTDDYTKITKAVKEFVDVNSIDKHSRTALHYVANCDSKKQYADKLSIGQGSSVEVASGIKLFIGKAARYVPVKIANYLIKSGIDLNIKDKHGKTALDYAIENELTSLVNTLKRYTITSEDEKLPEGIKSELATYGLNNAALSGNIERAKQFIENGANVSAVGINSFPPLHLAVLHNNYETVKLLVNNRAIINQKDKSGKTALNIAFEKFNLEIIELLLQNGANPNVKNKKKKSLLKVMMEKGHLDIAKLLIEYGADIDEKYNGRSLLHTAVLNNNEKYVTFLLEHGAFVDIKDDAHKKTPLTYATDSNNDRISDILMQYGADDAFKYIITNKFKDISKPPRELSYLNRHKLHAKENGDFSKNSGKLITIFVLTFFLILAGGFNWLTPIRFMGKKLKAKGTFIKFHASASSRRRRSRKYIVYYKFKAADGKTYNGYSYLRYYRYYRIKRTINYKIRALKRQRRRLQYLRRREERQRQREQRRLDRRQQIQRRRQLQRLRDDKSIIIRDLDKPGSNAFYMILDIEYLKRNPKFSRVKGGYYVKAGSFKLFLVIPFVILIILFLLLLRAPQSKKAIKLLRKGMIADGKIISIENRYDYDFVRYRYFDKERFQHKGVASLKKNFKSEKGGVIPVLYLPRNPKKSIAIDSIDVKKIHWRKNKWVIDFHYSNVKSSIIYSVIRAGAGSFLFIYIFTLIKAFITGSH